MGFSAIQLPGPREGPGRVDSRVLGARREAVAWPQGDVTYTGRYAVPRPTGPRRSAEAFSESPEPGTTSPSQLPMPPESCHGLIPLTDRRCNGDPSATSTFLRRTLGTLASLFVSASWPPCVAGSRTEPGTDLPLSPQSDGADIESCDREAIDLATAAEYEDLCERVPSYQLGSMSLEIEDSAAQADGGADWRRMRYPGRSLSVVADPTEGVTTWRE